MQPIEKSLRNQLERAVKEAREVAEDAARAVLTQLGVGEALPFSHLTESERELRRKLRAHGRQLGDRRDPENETQDIDRLVEEVAYEHWHRMLFARFLAENDLLMFSEEDFSYKISEDSKNTDNCTLNTDNFFADAVAITLEEAEDIAHEYGLKNGWELSAKVAAQMLPQIFRPGSPVFQLELPPEYQQKLERLLVSLPTEVFTASDSLGWVYQFWQAKKKDEVNASEVKIGARELPAVTQLFTEPYMVSFLLDNSLGAWFVGRQTRRVVSGQLSEFSKKAIDKLKHAQSEEELREFFKLPGVPLSYLRFVKTEHCTLTTDNSSVFKGLRWMPAAGWFEGWPQSLADLKTLDPCCGSGHFLVAALLMLVPMRMELEGLTPQEAVDAVLRDNLHGLEIDQRCVELAAFALALTAWRYPGAGGYRKLPELNLACSGLSVSVSKEEWQKLANGNRNLRIALGWIYDEFQNAPVLGSLLDPAKSAAAKLVDWKDLAGTLETALAKERSDEEHEAGVVAHGLAKAAMLLTGEYNLVVTNVPYLGRVKQDEKLRKFCERYYRASKNDLSTVFLERCISLTQIDGTSCVVLPQNWLFLPSYKKVRKNLLRLETWNVVSRLGPGAFETISGEVVKAILLILSRQAHKGSSSKLFVSDNSVLDHRISGFDVSVYKTAEEKAIQLRKCCVTRILQADQLKNPDSTVLLEETDKSLRLLGNFATVVQGVGSTDAPRFIIRFWEISPVVNVWDYYQMAPTGKVYSGATSLLRWENGEGVLAKIGTARKGLPAVGKPGFAIAVNSTPVVSVFMKHRFDCTTAVLLPNDENHSSAIGTFLRDESFPNEARKVDQALSITESSFGKIPFDLDHWTKVAQQQYPNGLPRPYSNDPTQWIFHGHPCGSVIWDEEKKWTAHGPLRTDSTVLQVAVARLLGYRWPAETELRSERKVESGKSSEVSSNTDNFPLKTDDCSLKRPDFELSDESWYWVKQCEKLTDFADEDGIVCIHPVRGEASAADRLLNLLAAAYKQVISDKSTEFSTNTGNATYTEHLLLKTENCNQNTEHSFSDWIQQLLASADHGGKSLETWLRDKFFAQHCKLFHHRPFIWHIWDGLRDGFAALVNYHKLDRKNLETLIYAYLGDWINRQKGDIENGIDGAEEKLAAAESLKKKLELILKGESPHDIFVRWKPIDKQPIGWEPDLNDGVRLNIRPFMTVGDACPRNGRRVKKKGAGILRDKPNIKWNKDRGKDVPSAPWYHLGPQYGGKEGDRINDHHLTLEKKRKARKEAVHE